MGNSAPAYEHLYDFGVVVVEKQTFACVEAPDFLHILVGEREVKDVEILAHALYMGRLRNDDYVALI